MKCSVKHKIKSYGMSGEMYVGPRTCWITGNEMADRLAKRALTKDNVEVQVNVSKAEVKCIIWRENQ